MALSFYVLLHQAEVNATPQLGTISGSASSSSPFVPTNLLSHSTEHTATFVHPALHHIKNSTVSRKRPGGRRQGEGERARERASERSIATVGRTSTTEVATQSGAHVIRRSETW